MRPDNLASQYLFTEILVYFNVGRGVSSGVYFDRSRYLFPFQS